MLDLCVCTCVGEGPCRCRGDVGECRKEIVAIEAASMAEGEPVNNRLTRASILIAMLGNYSSHRRKQCNCQEAAVTMLEACWVKCRVPKSYKGYKAAKGVLDRYWRKVARCCTAEYLWWYKAEYITAIP